MTYPYYLKLAHPWNGWILALLPNVFIRKTKFIWWSFTIGLWCIEINYTFTAIPFRPEIRILLRWPQK